MRGEGAQPWRPRWWRPRCLECRERATMRSPAWSAPCRPRRAPWTSWWFAPLAVTMGAAAASAAVVEASAPPQPLTGDHDLAREEVAPRRNMVLLAKETGNAGVVEHGQSSRPERPASAAVHAATPRSQGSWAPPSRTKSPGPNASPTYRKPWPSVAAGGGGTTWAGIAKADAKPSAKVFTQSSSSNPAASGKADNAVAKPAGAGKPASALGAAAGGITGTSTTPTTSVTAGGGQIHLHARRLRIIHPARLLQVGPPPRADRARPHVGGHRGRHMVSHSGLTPAAMATMTST